MPKSSNAASELSPKYAVMGFLYMQPMHGYELHKHLESSLREVWHISQSQTYNILKHLEKDQLITVTLQSQEKKPDRELLKLTEAGRSAFEIWLYAPTLGSARAIRVEFITRLFFASNTHEGLCSRLIQEQADMIRSQLAGLIDRRTELPPDQIFNDMGLDFRIRQLNNVLGWVEDCHQHMLEEARL
jgi:DNA-binding PadR family transcriptional regulator